MGISLILIFLTIGVVSAGSPHYQARLVSAPPASKVWAPGTHFTLTCMLNPRNSDFTMQIVKTKIEFRGSKSYFSASPLHNVYLISNGSELYPPLAEYTDRYDVTEDSTGSLIMSVRDGSYLDSGVYACRAVNQGQVIATSSKINITVEGPMSDMRMFYVHGDNFFEPVEQEEYTPGANISINEFDQRKEIVCSLNITNVEANYTMTLNNGTHTISKTNYTSVRVGGDFARAAQVLMDTKLIQRISIGTRGGIFEYKNHGSIVTCTASLAYHPPISKSISLNILFEPKNVTCRRVTGERKYLTCTGTANPLPRDDQISWTDPQGNVLQPGHSYEKYNVINTGSRTNFTVQLEMTNPQARYFGVYRAHFSNDIDPYGFYISIRF